MMQDMNDFEKVNKVYANHFISLPLPARSCIAVKALPKQGKVEIEVIATKE